MKVLRRRPDDELVALARGIVRGDYLIVDDDPLWAQSLAFFGEAITNTRNLGAVLVPTFGKHAKGYWINGRVPGVTVELKMVALGDLPKLRRHLRTMNAALWPEEAT